MNSLIATRGMLIAQEPWMRKTMYIKNISAENLKGLTFDQELKPLSMIVGPNFSGKSARLMAIRLALMGFDPQMGKGNPATFKLSSSTSMKVGVKLSDDQEYNRTWTQDNKGSVKCSGTLQTISNPTLDSSIYFSLSATEKMKYLFRTADLSKKEWNAQTIIEEILHAVEEGGGKRDPVEDSLKISDGSIQVTIETWIDDLKKLWSDANAEKKRCDGTLLKLTELKNADASATANQIGTVRKDIAIFRDDANSISKQIGELQGEMDSKQRRTTELKSKIEKIEALPSVRSLKDDLTKQIGSISYEEALKHHTDIDKATGEMVNKMNALMGEREILTKKIDSLKDHSTCPTCGAKASEGLSVILKDIQKEFTSKVKTTEALREEYATSRKALQLADSTLKDARDRKQKSDSLKIKIAEAEQLNKQKDELVAEFKKLSEDVKAGANPADNGKMVLLKNKLSTIQADIKTKDEILAKLEATKRDQILLEETKAAHESAEAELISYKIAGQFLKDKQEQLVKDVMGPITTNANRIFFSVTNKKLDIHNGDIGYWSGHRFVNHEAFSGSEQALAYVGFTAALVINQSLRLVILDEFGRVSHVNKIMVLNILKHCVDDGTIDQAIVVDTSKTPCEGWEVINT